MLSTMKVVIPAIVACGERARDVVADRDGHPVDHAVDERGVFGAHQHRALVEPPSPAAHHEDAEDDDRHTGEDRVHEAEAEVAQRPRRPAEAARQLARLLLDLRHDAVVLLEAAQRLVSLDEALDVGGVARRVVGEVVRAGDDRRHDDRAEPDRDEQQADVRQADGNAAAAEVAVQEVHRPRHRDREERRDDDPAERLAQQVQEVQRDRDRHDDEHVAQHRARRRLAWVGRHRARSIGTAPDGPPASALDPSRPRSRRATIQREEERTDMVILGIVLVLAGAGLMVAEAHLPTAGILGLLGWSRSSPVARSPSTRRAGASPSWSSSTCSSRYRGVTLAAVVRGTRGRVARGREDRGRGPRRPYGRRPPGTAARRAGVRRRRALERAAVRVRGAGPTSAGDPVVVERVKGLTLSVRRAEEWELDYDRGPRRPHHRHRRRRRARGRVGPHPARVRARRRVPLRPPARAEGPGHRAAHPRHRPHGPGRPAHGHVRHPAAGPHHPRQRPREGQRRHVLPRRRPGQVGRSRSSATGPRPRRSPRRRCARCSARPTSTCCSPSASASTRRCSRSSTSRPTRGASRSRRSRSRTSGSRRGCSGRWRARRRPSASAARRSSTPRASSRPPSACPTPPQIISANPTALQLRYLQTLLELGSSQASTIVFPLPIDLLKPLLQATQYDGTEKRPPPTARRPTTRPTATLEAAERRARDRRRRERDRRRRERHETREELDAEVEAEVEAQVERVKAEVDRVQADLSAETTSREPRPALRRAARRR